MYSDHSVGVIVPAYNEAGLVGDVLAQIPEYVDGVYVIDDASTDDTWDEIIATARASTDRPPADAAELVTDGGRLRDRASVHEPIGRIVPIRHSVNLGAGGAIKTGYMAALRDGVDVVATIDGDGQMDLDQLPRLLDPIVEGEADYAKGNRLLYRDYRQEMPGWRFFGNSILTFLTKIASGYWKMMDPQNGYTAISHQALDNVGVEDMYEYYGYCNDLLVKLNAKGLRVADVAMPAVYGDERSSISYHQYIRKVSAMLLENFLWRLKVRYFVLDFHPLGLFYLFGAAMTGFGTLGMFWALITFVTLEGSFFIRFSLSGLVFTMGSMFLMFAMLFDMQANEEREVQIYE